MANTPYTPFYSLYQISSVLYFDGIFIDAKEEEKPIFSLF